MKISKKRAEVSEGLKALRQRLDRWRRGKKTRRERIPEEFWQEAAEAAQVHGVSAVAVNLRLDYCRLREWAGIKKSGRAKRNLDAEPTFLEAHELGVLIAGGDPGLAQGAPVWRKVRAS